MIRSFGSEAAERIRHEQYVKRVDRTVQRAALRMLGLIHTAKDVEDLRFPPGNRVVRLVRGVAMIGQDVLRREILHVRDHPGVPRAPYIDMPVRVASTTVCA